jgi:GTP-binding protein YchF
MQAIEEEVLDNIMVLLDKGKAARAAKLTPEQKESIRHLQLLTMKPLTYAANVAEDELAEPMSNSHVQALHRVAQAQSCQVVTISAQVEAELNQLDDAEAAEYLEALGVTEGGLKSLVRATYQQLGLCTYFTTGEKETRAWTFRNGMTAPQCAGVIHTDFEKKFIRAETVSYPDFITCQGYSIAKEKGLLRLEGKEYVVQEGDVMLFRTGA